MKLHDLHPAPGAHKPPRRVGRGHGSGRGKTAGRGTKGQKARAGGGIQPWFEGGQTPLHVRTPKLHGFKNRFRVEYAPVNLAKIAHAEKGTLITPDALVHDGLLRDTKLPLKILGNGDAPKGVTVHAHAFSRVAREKLEAAGSTAQRISWPEGNPVEDLEEPVEAGEADGGAAERTEAAGEPQAVEEPSAQATDETASESESES